MANTTAHIFVSAKADGTDPLQVQPSNWNAGHIYSGGNTGSILCRDASDATYGASWVQSVATGQVLTSAGAGTLPAWSASPTLTSVLISNAQSYNAKTAAAATVPLIGISGGNDTLLGNSSGNVVPQVGDSASGGDLGNAATRWKDLYLGGSLRVSGTGPHAIGGVTQSFAQLSLYGSFAPTGTGAGFYFNSTLSPTAGNSVYGMDAVVTFVKAASGNHPLFATHYIDIASITAGAATISNTASLYIAGPISTTVSGVNYALWIATGTTVRWGGYGAGAATFDASGNITSVSDACLKTSVRDYTFGLAAVRKLRPVFHRWNDQSHLDQDHDYVSFIAQEVEAVLGSTSVGHDENGYLTLQERAIIGATVRAIQELADRVDRLEIVH